MTQRPVTIQDANKSLRENGIDIELPYPRDWVLIGMKILEKKYDLNGKVAVLLSLQMAKGNGTRISEIIHCEGKAPRKMKHFGGATPDLPLKASFLPEREHYEFTSDDEARDYLKKSIDHLLLDKGFILDPDHEDPCLYTSQRDIGIFTKCAPRCDELGLDCANELIALRQKTGSNHDFILAVPAFQESLGLSMLFQEAWANKYMDYLTSHRICLCGVDNKDPNQVYAFTVYPRSRELVSYFVVTTQQWSMVRERYILNSERTGSRR
ncbi:MAG: hypothetical protein H6Q52_93 [Deltaproteobacteria bacterium]|nr:hypothetical protein [Deltaproteobacteria bacterium]